MVLYQNDLAYCVVFLPVFLESFRELVTVAILKSLNTETSKVDPGVNFFLINVVSLTQTSWQKSDFLAVFQSVHKLNQGILIEGEGHISKLAHFA
jgi:hypothetical protein